LTILATLIHRRRRQVLSQQTDKSFAHITLEDGRCAVAKYSMARVWGKVPEGNTLIFWISLKDSVA